MPEISAVGLDLAKNLLVAVGASLVRAHGADASGRPVLQENLRRDQVPAIFGQSRPCVVAMEA